MKEPNVIINQVKTLVINKSLTNELQLLPDRVYPFYMEMCNDCIKVHIVSENHFTGCWFSADINPKTQAYRFKAGRGEALATVLSIQGFKPLTNYKVVDIIPKCGFTIAKEEL